jgi:hypothetical protein
MKKAIFSFVLILVLAISFDPLETQAQCAMCKAQIENNVREGKGLGQGVRSGIVYMMIFPYLLVGSIGYFWYRRSKKQKAIAKKNAAIVRKAI